MLPKFPEKKEEVVLDSTTGARFIKVYSLRKTREEDSEEHKRKEEQIGRISPTQKLCQTFDFQQGITRVVATYDCYFYKAKKKPSKLRKGLIIGGTVFVGCSVIGLLGPLAPFAGIAIVHGWLTIGALGPIIGGVAGALSMASYTGATFTRTGENPEDYEAVGGAILGPGTWEESSAWADKGDPFSKVPIGDPHPCSMTR